MWAALAVLAALRERDQHRARARRSRTALFDTALAWIPYQLMGVPRDRRGAAAPGLGGGDDRALPGVPDGGRLAHDHDADGRALRPALRGARASPELAADPRYRTNPDRVRHRATLVPALEALTRPWPTAALLERLRAGRASPRRPVQTVDQVVTDPQTKASEMLVPTPRPDIPDLTTVALPVRFGDERPAPRRPPPRVGEHTIDVLGELGFGALEMGELRAQGVVDWPLRRVSGRCAGDRAGLPHAPARALGGRPRPHRRCSTGPRS